MIHIKTQDKSEKNTKACKLRKLKRLAGMDPYSENEEELEVYEAAETIESMLLFMTDPIVKKKLNKDEFKKINNALVDILDALESVRKREKKEFKKI